MKRCKVSIEDLQLAFLCGLHERLGSESPVKRLHVDMCKYIAQEAKYFHVSHFKRVDASCFVFVFLVPYACYISTLFTSSSQTARGQNKTSQRSARLSMTFRKEGDYTEYQSLKICKRLTIQAYSEYFSLPLWDDYEPRASVLTCSLVKKEDCSDTQEALSSSAAAASSSPSSSPSSSDLEWPEELLMAIPPTLGGGILADALDEEQEEGGRREEEGEAERMRIRSRLQEEKEGTGAKGSKVVLRMWSGECRSHPRCLVCVVGSQTQVELNGLTILLYGGKRPEEGEGSKPGDCTGKGEGEGGGGADERGGDRRDGEDETSGKRGDGGGKKSSCCEEEVR
eukprot:764678-Hanusia_phi.AAC.7